MDRLPERSGCRILISAFSMFCVVLLSGMAQGVEVLKTRTSETREILKMSDAVLRALEHNLDITVSRQNREIRQTDIIFEQANFDPTFEASGGYDRLLTPLNRPLFGFSGSQIITNEPQLFDQRIHDWSLGLKQKLITGTEYDFAYEQGRTNVSGQTNFLFNPVWESRFRLSLTQPLLKNFGPDVNETQIKIARNNARVEDHVFLNSVLIVIGAVEENYWTLVYAREVFNVAQIALKAAEELEVSNRAKAKTGVMTIVDVLQAQAAVASRQEEVIVAERAIRDQADQLRQLLNPSEGELRQEVEVIPLDKPVQALQPIALQEAIDVALQRRPEVLQASTNIENSDLNVKFAKNQLLPSLTLEGSGSLIGIGKSFGDMNDRGFDGDFYDYGVGLMLRFPLGNRAAWSQYRKNKIQARNAHVTLQSARQEVIISVKQAVRRVHADFKRIETTRSARILAKRQLKVEEERLRLGLTTTRFVLDFQRDLAIAQRNELQAIIDYNKGLSNLARQKATTLEPYGIKLMGIVNLAP